jgi:hypothetical protein
VRLARCVLFELAVGVTLIAGAGGGVYLAAREVANLVGAAHAAHASAPGPRLDRPLLQYPLPRLPEVPASGYFLGIKDEILTAPLERAEIVRVRFNRGGSSVSLRIDFADGSRAAFKPDQINLWSIPRKEIAAYRMSRLLGLEAVAPAVGRAFLLQELIDKLEPASADLIGRLRAEAIAREDGMVAGELSWWIPTIVDASLEGLPIDSAEGIAAWRRYLAAGAPEPYSGRHLLPQISNMVVFDYLINNADRFSGSNAKASPDGRTLFFMDNTLSFGTVREGSTKVRTYLEKVQKVSRSLVRRVRALDEATLRAAMGPAGPYERVLQEEEIAAVLYRRDRFLDYVDALTASHGEGAVLVYP